MSEPTLETITLTANAIMGKDNIPIIVGLDKYTYTNGAGSITRDAHSLKVATDDGELTKLLFKPGDRVGITGSTSTPTLGSVAGSSWKNWRQFRGDSARVLSIAANGDVAIGFYHEIDTPRMISPEFLYNAPEFQINDWVVCDKGPEPSTNAMPPRTRMGKVVTDVRNNIVEVSFNGAHYKCAIEWLRVVTLKEYDAYVKCKTAIEELCATSAAETLTELVADAISKRRRVE